MSFTPRYTCACPNCGLWVPAGQQHYCIGLYGGTVTPPPQDSISLALGRIEALLVQVLAKLNEKAKP